MVNKVALGKVFFRALLSSPVSIISSYTFVHISAKLLNLKQPAASLNNTTTATTTTTPWSRVLLEKLTSKLCSLSRNSPHLWNPKVPHRTHKCPPPVPILSQLHPAPTTPSNFLKNYLNIILPSTSWSPQWPLSLRLPHQHPLHTSILPTIHATTVYTWIHTIIQNLLIDFEFVLCSRHE